MSLFVVDASVGIKWFVPEVLAANALQVRRPEHILHVPTLFDVEMGNIVWKKVRRGELSNSEGAEIVAQLPGLPVERHAELPLLAAAFDLAIQTQRSVYDSLYLALAIALGGRVVTADERFVNSLATTPYAASIEWLGDEFFEA